MGNESGKSPHIVWVYTASLEKVLDAATWLKPVEELRKSGKRMTLLAVGKRGIRKIRGVEVLCFPRPEIYFLRHIIYQAQALWFLLKNLADIDVILFHEFSSPFILLLKPIRLLTGKRRPLFVMDTRSLPMQPEDSSSLKVKVRRKAHLFMHDLGNRYADGRLAITQRMAEAVHIPEKKLWGTWPSGVDIDHFKASRASRRFPTIDESIHLIYHGYMGYERNLMKLCQAVIRANSEGMRFELSLVGDGPERRELKSFARTSGEVIKVIPSIPNNEIPKVLAQSHVGVLPFPDEEKFRASSPIKLFEYMAAGMPILVTRIACHTDVVGNGGYAIWAEDASVQGLLDALQTAWQSRDAFAEMGKQAAIAAEDWSWKASAGKLMKALEIGLENH
ncbi:MAG: glycosyltransferase family 4 protein [Anaerolineales bacterium]|jgi:glycosyltransferase involved in cell wall biosynthesis